MAHVNNNDQTTSPGEPNDVERTSLKKKNLSLPFISKLDRVRFMWSVNIKQDKFSYIAHFSDSKAAVNKF